MKNILPLFYLLLLNSVNAYSQVVFTEDFDNYIIDNLGTDPNGNNPGQGGWLTTAGTNSHYKIISESNKGNVLSISTDNPKLDTHKYFNVKKVGLRSYIDQKSLGNNVIKIEFDFYTGLQSQVNFVANDCSLRMQTDNPIFNQIVDLFEFSYNHSMNHVNLFTNIGNKIENVFQNQYIRSLNVDTWYNVNIYLDYNKNAIYLNIPSLNILVKGSFLSKTSSPNISQDYKIDVVDIRMYTDGVINNTKRENRIDNIKITALKDVTLSVDEFLNEKFNVFPNPVSNIVNITNSENITVNKVTLYDITGKLIKEINYNAESNINLNIENFQNGTYLLHLETNSGKALKKIIKQN